METKEMRRNTPCPPTEVARKELALWEASLSCEIPSNSAHLGSVVNSHFLVPCVSF